MLAFRQKQPAGSKIMRKSGLKSAVWIGLCLAALPASAQEFPARSITMIVPFAAGGSSDVHARLLTEQMSQHLGQRFVIENIPGAGGLTALTRLTQAPADGYTIAIGNSGTNTAVYLFNPEVKFTHEDFAPIGLFARSTAVVLLKKGHQANTLAEFIAHAKANPGKTTIGHSGLGSQNYLFCKTLIQAAGIDVTMVGYRGGGPALNDLIAGQIDGICDSSSSATPAIVNGLVKGVALAANARLPTLPDVPTATEAGLPQFQIQGWYALFAPKTTPAPIVAKLNDALRKGVANADFQKKLDALGSYVIPDSEIAPDHLRAFVPREIERFRALIADGK
jgi:tripartite-type tricarboxylate transporter receptor subunit TctC